MADIYDISLDFTLDSTGDIKLVEDNNAVAQSIRNIILTPTGFKPGVGDVNDVMGVGLNEYLFAPLNSFTGRSLGEAIQRHVTIFEPRVNVDDVRIVVDTTKRLFEIELDYSLVKSGQEFTFRTVINQI